MTEQNRNISKRRVKRIGLTGVAIGLLTVLACELPILLAILGLAGISTSLSVYSLPPLIESIGYLLGFAGLLTIASLVALRAIHKVRS